MQYGFQRLVLLGSAGYSRAELPLDGAVSLVAPNNTGKTSLINALQFLLIIDRRRMDFGAHDVDKSRRFYFPNNSAYVLLEVSLPETGTVVLGCVGKGVSFDYEYFAYSGPLKIDEFCLPNGQLVSQPQLASHLATYGRRVFSYNSSEFADMVYGGKNRKLNSQQDFCVFRLENAKDASIFQRVLTRTLRLDKLRSNEVKDYLLQIFHRDLPDASIDFKAEWDKAFASLNAERSQYLAASNLLPTLEILETKQEERKILRGKLICWQPLIEAALSQWQEYYDSQKAKLQDEVTECGLAIQKLREDDRQLVRSQTKLEQEQNQLLQQNTLLAELQQRFMLVNDFSILESNQREKNKDCDKLIYKIEHAKHSSPVNIKRDLKRLEQEMAQIQHELKTNGNNLHQHLSEYLSAPQLQALNKTLSKSVLTLGPESFSVDEQILAATLTNTDTDHLSLPGLHINIENLLEQHQQKTPIELQQLLQDKISEQRLLSEQLSTAEELELVKNQRLKLEQELAQLATDIHDYQHMERLQEEEKSRGAKLQQLGQDIHDLNELLLKSSERDQALNQSLQQYQNHLNLLEAQHRQIDQRRNQRIDHETTFSWLPNQAHYPWLAQSDFELDQLSERLQTYLIDCRQLVDLNDKISNLLSSIHSGGLTKYQFDGQSETEIDRLIDFAHHLPQEAEALEKKVRSAVVNVAACLRELRDGLHAFKRRMREFNRKISGRQLSDLAVFKIEPEDASALVEAIELLINTSTTVDSGEVFDLFNQQSILDDVKLNQAKTLLIEEGNARNGLHVTDLFHLRFWVGKTDQEAEAFDDLDSAASNGTVLMAKLVTGLAMLHLMQDQQRPIQGICYLDEALALDARNQRNLIDTAAEFGFSLIFASPAPLTTVRYCVPIHHRHGKNQISRFSWQIIEPIEV